MNILITGSNGQLGMVFRSLASQSRHRFVFSDITTIPEAETQLLDICDLAAVRDLAARESIDLIINCAAYTNVDAAENDEERCERINHYAVENLARVMLEREGWLFHVSTDYVFGKELYNTPCSEDQVGTPIGVYGRTKKQGEEAIRRVGCQHLIVRTAWLYSEYGKNFLKTMLQLTATKPELRVVIDQVGTPTYARDLGEALLQIVETQHYEGRGGTYHYSNEGVCSWYDFAVTIAEFAGREDCRILPCRSSEYPSAVTRPAYSVLDKTKIKNSFGLSIPYWTDSLLRCLAALDAVAELQID